MTYGEKIAELRKSKGMTQAELGNALNVTFQAVSKWERDESLPDFATISKIAKLFGVPITYFEESEDGNEQQDENQSEPDEAEAPREIIGVCTKCGKMLHEGDEETMTPAIICKDCAQREKRNEAIRKENEEKRKESERRAKEARIANEKAEIKRKRNIGLIVGGIVAAIFLIITIVSAARGNKADIGATIGGGLIMVVISFSYASQLVWDGVVRAVTLTGGKIVGMPGVIFDLDLDGFIFLIVVKILFAIIKFLIFIITLLFFVVVAIVISPFTFIPCLIRVSRGIESEF